MSRSRILQIILALLVLLGLLLWLVSTLVNLYAGLANFSPLLANVVIWLVIVLIAVLVSALGYYAWLFLRPRQQRLSPRIPEARTEAAEENLRAVQHQVEQIQDEVARQAFAERTKRVKEYLARGEIRVVVFGTGSAGKTSLVNAVLGEMVGQVGAAMGTTTEVTTYKFRLPGIERDIWLTDTPGILEAGVAGTEREQLARKLAAEADLLLFVVDSDLRKSEYDPLRSLADSGKRSILDRKSVV